jgi:hypothetical protein
MIQVSRGLKQKPSDKRELRSVCGAALGSSRASFRLQRRRTVMAFLKSRVCPVRRQSAHHPRRTLTSVERIGLSKVLKLQLQPLFNPVGLGKK